MPRRHNITRTLIWLGPLVLLASSPLWLGPVGRFLEPRGGGRAAAPRQSSPLQNFSLSAVTITLTSKGRPEWRVNAVQAFTGEKDNEIELVEVRAESLDKSKPPTHVESRRGLYQVTKRVLTLKEDVHMVKPTLDQELRTELMHYYDEEKKAVSPGEVEIESPGLRLKAGGMDYNFDKDSYDFKNRVRVFM